MRSRLFAAASAATVTVVLLGVPAAGPSSAQTPSTVFVGVFTVTSPPVVPAPVSPTPQVTGVRRTVSCRTYYRGHGKGRHVWKRKCRTLRVSEVQTRRTVQTVSVPQPTFVVPPPATFVVPPPATFAVAPPPPPTFVVPPPPVFVVNVAVAPVVKKDDQRSSDAKHDKKKRARGEGKEKDRDRGKSKSKDRDHDDD